MHDHGPQDPGSPTTPASAGTSRRRVTRALIAVVAVVTLAAVIWNKPRGQPAPTETLDRAVDSEETATDGSESAVESRGYVGPAACAACHAERLAEMQVSAHFRTCRVPRPDEMPPKFSSGHEIFGTRHAGLRFEMTRAGNEFFEAAIRTTPQGEQRAVAPINLVYGAGMADDVYLSWHEDGRLFELPVVWLYPLQRWGVSPYDPYASGDYSRPLLPRCLECHNTHFQHVPGTPNQYKRDQFILGVTCESCHGPGREHVTFHKDHPEATAAHSIVQPGRLPRDLQLDVCLQCHSNAIRHRGPAFRYRPGEPLEKYYKAVTTRHTEEDHVANQIQYLRQSKCFQRSDDLTCVTCHAPHRPKSSANSSAAEASCLKCHQPADCLDRDRLPPAVQDQCVDCHMPRYIKINVNFDLEDELYVPPIRRSQHRIAVHPEARQEVLLTWYREQPDDQSRDEAAQLINALVAHWLAEAESCRREHRFMGAIAALREALRLDPPTEARDTLRSRLKEVSAIQCMLDDLWNDAGHQISTSQSAEAIETLNRILRIKPDDAKAHARLGTLLAMSGQVPQAIDHLQQVARYDPDNPSGHSMLGWLAYLDNRPDEALKNFRRAEEVEPYNGKLNYQIGLAYARLNQLPEAVEHFRRSLTIDPHRVEVCQSLSLSLRQQGNPQQALPFARRAARLADYQNVDVLLTLAETCSEAGRPGEAVDALNRAMNVARKNEPDRLAYLARLRETYHSRAKLARPGQSGETKPLTPSSRLPDP